MAIADTVSRYAIADVIGQRLDERCCQIAFAIEVREAALLLRNDDGCRALRLGIEASRTAWSRYRRARSFLTNVAAVAQVAVAEDGTVAVPRVDLAVDCGMVVNPDRVAAQFEGAALMGLGNTLYSSMTFKHGRATETNFGDYLVPRVDATPETHVHVVRSEAPPGEVGEPGVPPVSAAICNAIFHAVGHRVRALPVDPAELKAA